MQSLTPSNTLNAHAAHDLDAAPAFVEFFARVATLEEADALLETFPKSQKFRVCRDFGTDPATGEYMNSPCFGVYSRIVLTSTRGNERNETGIKRYQAILASAKKLGYAIRWTAPYRNSYQTQETFEAAL